ncbi:hypothetical protein T492DRAFT_855631, partial [Pavlovales sp. CCMP2436]
MLDPQYTLADYGYTAGGVRSPAASRPSTASASATPRKSGSRAPSRHAARPRVLDIDSLLDLKHARYRSESLDKERFVLTAARPLDDLRLDHHKQAPSWQQQRTAASGLAPGLSADGRPSTAPAQLPAKRPPAPTSRAGLAAMRQAQLAQIDQQLTAMSAAELAASVDRTSERLKLADAASRAKVHARARPPTASRQPLSDQLLGPSERPATARPRMSASFAGGPMRKSVKSTSRARAGGMSSATFLRP